MTIQVSKYAGGKVDVTSGHAGRQWIEKLLGMAYGPPGPREYDNSSLGKFEIHHGYGTSRMLRPKKFKHAERKYEIDVYIESGASRFVNLSLPSITRDAKTGLWRIADCWKETDVAVTWPSDICDAFYALTALPNGEDLAMDYALDNIHDGAYMVTARRLESKRSILSINVVRRFEMNSPAEIAVFYAAEFIFRWLVETKQLKANRGSKEVQTHDYCKKLVQRYRNYVHTIAPIATV